MATLESGHQGTDGRSVSYPANSADQRFDGSRFGRRRPLFWLALVFCAGISLDHFLEPALSSLGTWIVIALLFALYECRQHSPARRIAAAAIFSLCAGMFIHATRHRIPGGDDISRQTPVGPSLVWLRGTIVEAEKYQRSRQFERQVWTMRVAALGAGRGALAPASGWIRLTLPIRHDDSDTDDTEKIAAIGIGDEIECLARVEAPPAVTVPNSFDYAGFLAGQGIRRVGVIIQEDTKLLAAANWLRPDLMLRRSSIALSEKMESALPQSYKTESERRSIAGLLDALLFGRKEQLSWSDREAFAISGTAHLLAISGSHIYLLAWLLWKAFAFFGINRRRGALFTAAICIAYTFLAGADSPIMRSTIMIVSYLLATILWREPDPLCSLAASALALLLYNPADLFNAGFQLSFVAVFALITIYPALENAWTRWRLQTNFGIETETTSAFEKWQMKPRGLVFMTLVASLATAPIIAWHMGRFSTVTLLANVLAVPLSSGCMFAGVVLLIAPAGTLALIAGWITCLLCALLQFINSRASSIPFASIDTPAPNPAALSACAALFASGWVLRDRVRGRQIAAGSVAIVAMLISGSFFRDADSAPSITMLDLERGRCAVVESPSGDAALIDAGGPGQGPRIAETLRRRGINRLALLAFTEDDREALGGAVELVKRIAPARVVLPRAAMATTARRELERELQARNIPYGPPGAALSGPGNVQWDFISDGPAFPNPAANESNLAIHVTLPGRKVLFACSKSANSTQRLVAIGGDRLRADILRLVSGSGTRWAANTSKLIEASGCHTLIAGTHRDPDELPGLDLSAIAKGRSLVLLKPHVLGSIRVQADTGIAEAIQTFKDHKWRRAESN